MHTDIHTHMHTRKHTCTDTCTQTQAHTHAHRHMHTDICTHMQTHTHTHTHTCTHRHTHTCPLLWAVRCVTFLLTQWMLPDCLLRFADCLNKTVKCRLPDCCCWRNEVQRRYANPLCGMADKLYKDIFWEQMSCKTVYCKTAGYCGLEKIYVRDRESEYEQLYLEIIVKYYSWNAFNARCLYVCRRRLSLGRFLWGKSNRFLEADKLLPCLRLWLCINTYALKLGCVP